MIKRNLITAIILSVSLVSYTAYVLLDTFAIPRVYKVVENSSSSLIFYNTGIAALTIGSIVRGILDIYGTDNILVNVYRYAGAILVCLGVVFYAADRKGQDKQL